MSYKGVRKDSLTVIDESSQGPGKHKLLTCECDCGKTVKVQSHNFKKGKHCACKKHLFNDLTGKTFGKVKVLNLTKRSFEMNNRRGHQYKCQCLSCKAIYYYQVSALNRKKFVDCRCNPDSTLSSKRYWVRCL